MTGSVLGIQGPPGNGKTTLVRNGISKCFFDDENGHRPTAMIGLGGFADGAALVGHDFTYVGSKWGKIVDILVSKKCMNPIIYIDELDKVSNTEHGKEIVGILTHLTDASQNEEFEDKYFSGIKLDLSKALFIFSYNDRNKIDRILRDRITEVLTSSLKIHDKVNIVSKFVLPEAYEMNGFTMDEIEFPEPIIRYIINEYTYEAGVRKLKEKIMNIVQTINYNKIESGISTPFVVTESFVDEVVDEPKMLARKIGLVPKIGVINGLYASTSGIGGITKIEVQRDVSLRNLQLLLTGNQGDVMQESCKCGRTIALNILNKPDDKYEHGIHIHTPDAATPKDGPSAGTAITLALLSLLAQVPVLNDIALTGEIDLQGHVKAIGGLEEKLLGALDAGVRKVFAPKENYENYMKIQHNFPEEFEIVLVDHINELIDPESEHYVFTEPRDFKKL